MLAIITSVPAGTEFRYNSIHKRGEGICHVIYERCMLKTKFRVKPVNYRCFRRGVNGPTGFIVKAKKDDPQSSDFTWILNTDLRVTLNVL